MNHWARMLAEVPASLQRLIARTQRISLPRNCSAQERQRRLRQALCHAQTVRATYAALDADAQTALHELRTRKGGICEDELGRRYGSLRSWRQIEADPVPQNVTERLVVLGWLVPRPARPHHPRRYLLPPELRRWLPQPLQIVTYGPAPAPPPPPALRATATLLLACAEQPLPIRHDRTLGHQSVRLLAQRLAPLPERAVEAIGNFLLPLLLDLGYLVRHNGACELTLAGQRFLALSPAAQLQYLRQAWLTAAAPDPWLLPWLPNRTGIDWPLLRRRVCAWIAALPAGQLLDLATLYPALAATFGPLADAQTHGFRAVDRTPWQPQRAASIFAAAVRGPLSWLGWIAVHPSDGATDAPLRCARVADGVVPRPSPPAWQYGELGQVLIPHDSLNAAVLRLLPFADWSGATDAATVYRITPHTLVRAARDGWNMSTLWELVEEQAGQPPEAWHAGLTAPATTVQIKHAAVLLADPPAVLERAARARSVRRYLQTRLASGIALVQPEHVAPLLRTLQRQQIVAAIEPVPAAAPPADLSAAECAALLAACRFYRQCAPPGAPHLPDATLEARLRNMLPPGLGAAIEAAVAHLQPQQQPSAPVEAPAAACPNGMQPEAAAAPDAVKRTVQHAITTRQAVEITYQAASTGAWSRRTIYPLALEERGRDWYVRAYCRARDAERTFRLDGVHAIQVVGRTPSAHRRAYRRSRSAVANQDIQWIAADCADTQDLNAPDGSSVEQVAPDAVGLAIDDRA